jgi:glycosyltransferase involved in cell wall biosynthesis
MSQPISPSTSRPASQRLRILNVIHSVDPVHGGPAEGLRQSLAATAMLGHVEEVASLDDPGAACLAGYPAPLHALGPPARWTGTYGYTPGLVDWLKRHAGDYDAVVVHGMWQYHGLAVWRALRGGPVPYFVYFHGMLDPWFKRHYPLKHLKKWLYWPWADYRVARDAAAVLFTAEEERLLAAQSFWLYRVRPAVIGYGLRLDKRLTEQTLDQAGAMFKARYPATAGKRIVLFLGRLHVKKGCDLLIDAFGTVAAQHPDLHLVMAGPDQEGLQAGLEARARALGIESRISWTGMLNGDLKWGALRAAEVFALPSHQENFGIAVVEALALGVPVLISRRVNIWREVVDAGAGLAEDDDEKGTLALLKSWLALPEADRDHMRASAVQAYQSHFRMDATAHRLVSVIRASLRDTQNDLSRRDESPA